jgi:hypothetical protein
MRATVSALLVFASCLACAAASSTPPEGEGNPPPATAASVESDRDHDPSTPVTASSEPVGTEGRCVLADDWSACEGQRVELRGQAPQMVMQHPLLSQPEGLSPDSRNSYQGYVDVDGAQVIVLTKAAFACPGSMRVLGTLARVELGGEPGTKSSYAGWSISDALVTCE